MTPPAPTARPETPEERQKRIEPIIAQRMKKREEWEAFWKIFYLSSENSPMQRLRYYVWRGIDRQASFFREKIIEPLRDKYGHKPFYHRRFKRVPTVDECHVNDSVCYHEAQTQYKLDKQVDNCILDILRRRKNECMSFHRYNIMKCVDVIEDFEEAELNWYIKYGEMGLGGDVLTCYQKQKHRMIWERRNPEIMAERQRLYDEHKRKVSMGILDYWFWKRGSVLDFKDYMSSDAQRHVNIQPHVITRVSDPELVSADPEYYKQRAEAEKEGKTKNLVSAFEIFP